MGIQAATGMDQKILISVLVAKGINRPSFSSSDPSTEVGSRVRLDSDTEFCRVGHCRSLTPASNDDNARTAALTPRAKYCAPREWLAPGNRRASNSSDMTLPRRRSSSPISTGPCSSERALRGGNRKPSLASRAIFLTPCFQSVFPGKPKPYIVHSFPAAYGSPPHVTNPDAFHHSGGRLRYEGVALSPPSSNCYNGAEIKDRIYIMLHAPGGLCYHCAITRSAKVDDPKSADETSRYHARNFRLRGGGRGRLEYDRGSIDALPTNNALVRIMIGKT